MHTNFLSILITLLLLELFIGGSGQVFTLSGFPVRQIFFIALLFVYLVDIFSLRIKLEFDEYSFIVFCIVIWAFCSALIGMIRQHNQEIIFSDLSPMLYFLLYFPLSAYMKKYNIHFQYVFNLLVLSSFVVSISILFAYALLHLIFDGNVILLSNAIESLLGKDVFWYRHGGFIFYPGLYYVLFTSILLFGKIISLKKSYKYERLVYLVGIISIVISMTKGLILSLIVGHLLIFLGRKYSVNVRLTVMLFSVVIATAIMFSFDFSRFSQLSTDTGIINRLQVFDESLDKVKEAVIIGNGFGTELPTKKFHQENSFLDILVEQGLVGLSLYFLLILIIFYKRHVNFNLVIAVLSTVLMSFTNPAINNPLGIGVLILALVFVNSKRNIYFLGKI